MRHALRTVCPKLKGRRCVSCAESASFLYDLTLNDRGWPLIGGHVAEVWTCFWFRHA
jgi:hypothetical protein